jgi:hypothetical protein
VLRRKEGRYQDVLNPAESRSHLLKRIVRLEKKIQLLKRRQSVRDRGAADIEAEYARNVEGGMQRPLGNGGRLLLGGKNGAHSD